MELQDQLARDDIQFSKASASEKALNSGVGSPMKTSNQEIEELGQA